MKTALIIRHVEWEGVAGYREPIERAGYEVERVPAWALAGVDPLGPDLLVSMGGPMGAYERDAHPWIETELQLLRRRIAAGLPTLGVCLGAQLIAAAMGADVRPGPEREIGFAPLTLTESGRRGPLAELAGTPVLHWHGDTFDVPDGATLLARTALYPQAFGVGDAVLALQFHAEMGEDPRFEQWLENDAAYVAGAGLRVRDLRHDHDRLGPAAVAAGRAMLDGWLAALAASEAAQARRSA